MGKSQDNWVAGKVEIHNEVNYEENPFQSPGEDFSCFLAVGGAKWDPTPPKWWKQGRKQLLSEKYGE